MPRNPISTKAFDSFAADVRMGLNRSGQKTIPPSYFYDDIGTALFEVITLLPEYGLTRADQRLLKQNAVEITEYLPGRILLAELGSGTGRKTRWVLEALAGRQPVIYYPIDISASALAICRRDLGELKSVQIVEIENTYLEGLREVVYRRSPATRLLVLFLGSTIGNCDRPGAERMLRDIASLLKAGDALLLSTDLEKPVPRLVAAYDDPLGVTAAFNLNLLARINRELGGNFDLSLFQHQVIYNEKERRIEMHLRSTSEQMIHIPAADLSVTLRCDETIWTESSHKFNTAEMIRMAKAAGFRCLQQWVDEEWPFAQSLLIVD